MYVLSVMILAKNKSASLRMKTQSSYMHKYGSLRKVLLGGWESVSKPIMSDIWKNEMPSFYETWPKDPQVSVLRAGSLVCHATVWLRKNISAFESLKRWVLTF